MQQSIAAIASFAKGGRSALLSFAAVLIALPIGTTSAFAQLRGHGGPVRALAISADGQSAISGSFDSTAIRWSLTRNAAEQVLRFHSDAVNAVVPLAALADTAAAAAQKLAAKPPASLRLTKQLMKRGWLREIDAALAAESKAFQDRLASPEAKEAFTAFFEKRAADFSKFE